MFLEHSQHSDVSHFSYSKFQTSWDVVIQIVGLLYALLFPKSFRVSNVENWQHKPVEVLSFLEF